MLDGFASAFCRLDLFDYEISNLVVRFITLPSGGPDQTFRKALYKYCFANKIYLLSPGSLVMHSRALLGISVVTVLIGLAGSFQCIAQATTADKYLITAKAGGVNLVEGDVTISRAGGRSGLLIKGDEVQIGERVSTGVDGRAEILMNPGSFIRLGPDSSFEFASTDLDDVRLKMHKGSAILEVFGTEGFHVDLSADTARFTLLETGVYRINASPNGTSNIAVWKGKLRAGLEDSDSVGRGKIVSFDGKTYTVTKFDRDDQDAFAMWSRDRSKELSKISSTLRPDRLRDPLINSFYGGRWDLFNSFGLWVYDPFFRSFCFLPFGYGSSPYGFGFGRPIWYYNLPVAIYNVPPPVSTTGSGKRAGRDRPSEPTRSIGNTQRSRDAGDSKRSARDSIPGTIRDTIPRSAPAEPRIYVPRVEPVMPSVPAPTKRTRDN